MIFEEDAKWDWKLSKLEENIFTWGADGLLDGEETDEEENDEEGEHEAAENEESGPAENGVET